MKKEKQTRTHNKGIVLELPFKMDRIKIALRLKGITASELGKALHPGKDYNSSLVYHWIQGDNSPPKSEKGRERLEKISKYLEIPMSFFFYEKVEITLEKGLVTIKIFETDEVIKFMFVQGDIPPLRNPHPFTS